MTGRGCDFAALAHAAIIVEQRYPLEETAAALGLTYHALYARLSNRVAFSAEEIRALVTAAPDPRFVAYLLRGTPFVAADRLPPEAETAETIHRGATRLVIEATDVLEAVETALRDGRLDHREARHIRNEVEVAERALATLRERLRRALPAATEP